ncbi:MAG: dihydrofolate reductase [Pseudomonadota bacterium]
MSGSVRIALIVARARNGVIGRDGTLPWQLSDDLATFKKLTRGKPLIMGRRTWQSLPRRPLPGRPNLVLTRDWQFNAPGAHVFSEFAAALAASKSMAVAQPVDEVMVIGGEALYRDALGIADRLYVTDVDAAPEGDAYFPEFEEADFDLTEIGSWPVNDRNDHAFTITQYDRKR